MSPVLTVFIAISSLILGFVWCLLLTTPQPMLKRERQQARDAMLVLSVITLGWVGTILYNLCRLAFS